MTARDQNLTRARHVLAQIWLLALQTAACGWHGTDHLVLNGLAMAWRDTGRVMGEH